MKSKLKKIKTLKVMGKKLTHEPKIEIQIEKIKPQSQRIKKIHLTEEQVSEKIQRLSDKLKEFEGSDNKKKRKNIYAKLARLDKAKKNPETFLCDPVLKQEKLQRDKEKRIQKKIAKKKEIQQQQLSEQVEQEEVSDKRVRKTCLICKRKGHLAEECKENKDNQLLSHVCYYCGKKGHALKDCKKKRQAKLAGQEIELNFATCFICKKSGHIAKDCPQNEKGVYFRGGSCHLCGSVRHLAVDCDLHPNQQKKKLEQSYDNKQEPEF